MPVELHFAFADVSLALSGQWSSLRAEGWYLNTDEESAGLANWWGRDFQHPAWFMDTLYESRVHSAMRLFVF